MTAISTTAGNRWPSRLAYTAAAIFTAASGGTNLLYGWSKGGSDLGASLVWSAVSLGVSIVFSLSWPALIRCVDQCQWARSVMVLAALSLTGVYSVSAALGSAMSGRTNAASEEQSITDARAKAQAAYNSAELELKALPASRPAGELEALISREPKGTSCRVIVNLGERKTVCVDSKRLTDLKAELGRAERREKLQGALEKASEQLSGAKAPKVANGDAVALAAYLSGLGVDVGVDRLNKLLVLLAVLIVECGGGLALAVGMSLQHQEIPTGHPQDTHGTQLGQAVSALGQVSGQVVAMPSFRRPQPTVITGRLATARQLKAEAAGVHLLSLLQQNGGVLSGGQRQFAEVLGWSKSWTHEVLKRLARRGCVEMATGKTGTIVKLAT